MKIRGGIISKRCVLNRRNAFFLQRPPETSAIEWSVEFETSGFERYRTAISSLNFLSPKNIQSRNVSPPAKISNFLSQFLDSSLS